MRDRVRSWLGHTVFSFLPLALGLLMAGYAARAKSRLERVEDRYRAVLRTAERPLVIHGFPAAVWTDAIRESGWLEANKRLVLMLNSDSCRACESQEAAWRGLISSAAQFQVSVLSTEPHSARARKLCDLAAASGRSCVTGRIPDLLLFGLRTGIAGVPATVIVTPEGTVEAVHIGVMDAALNERLAEILKQGSSRTRFLGAAPYEPWRTFYKER